MRTLTAAAVLIAGVTAAMAADPYRWCAEGVNGCGTSSCYFKTLEQCRAATGGNNGGFCTLNPYYTGGADEPATHPARKRR